jgi:hypothetical protein
VCESQTDVILTAAQQAQWWRPGQRLVAAFGPQPRSVLVAAGNLLLRCSDGPLSGAPTLMHSRPAGEEITAVATVPEVRPPHQHPCCGVCCGQRQ